jgi:hypothetical protein
MDAAEKLDYAQARLVEGIGEEIAIARTLLLELIKDPDVDPEKAMEAAQLVGELVAIEYRTSRRAGEGLSESLASVLRSISALTAAPS